MTLGTLITMPKLIKIKIRVFKGNFLIDVKSENSLVLYTFIRFDEKAVEFLLLYSIRIVVGSTYNYEYTHQYGISDRRISPPLKDLSRYAKKNKVGSKNGNELSDISLQVKSFHSLNSIILII